MKSFLIHNSVTQKIEWSLFQLLIPTLHYSTIPSFQYNFIGLQHFRDA